MRLQELWDRHAGETIYVVGTGPSLRLLDMNYFAGRTTIGLKRAWRHLPTTYSLTCHPELVVEYFIPMVASLTDPD